MQLTDFFAPHTVVNVSLFLFIFILLDSFGSVVAHFLKWSPVLRLSHWLIGLSVWVLCGFILHFWFPTTLPYTLSSLLIFSVPSLWWYLRLKLWRSLASAVLSYPWLLIWLLPFAKVLWYHTALPPRVWDDMAYHFYSPSRLYTELTWQFRSIHDPRFFSFYDMLPRGIETAFLLLFSITKTYATAQLFQVLLYLTAISVAGSFLQKRVGWWAGALFAVVSLYLNVGILQASTTGYIDAGAAAYLLIFLVAVLEYLIEPRWRQLVAVGAFWGLAIGSKYTDLVFPIATFIATGLAGIASYWQKLISFPKKLVVREVCIGVAVIGLTALVTGGYWYVKNLLISGNPVYPFVFGCNGCPEAQALEGWGYLPFTAENEEVIINDLFYHTAPLYHLFLLALGLAVVVAAMSKNRSHLQIVVVLTAAVLTEVLLHQSFSLYSLRFFFHWLLLIPFILVLPLGSLRNIRRTPAWNVVFVVMLLYLSLSISIVKPMLIKNRDEFKKTTNIPDTSQWFAKGKVSLADWLRPAMPEMTSVVEWCGQPKDRGVFLHMADPELIWNFQGLARIFFVNCTLEVVGGFVEQDLASFAQQYQATHKGDYLISITPCDQILPQWPDPRKQSYAQLNQLLTCQSTPIQGPLYQL